MSRTGTGILLLALASSTGCAAGPPGKVDMRFSNKTGADIYLNGTYGPAVQIFDGDRELDMGGFCATSCDSCEDISCGSPLHVVRRVSPGQAFSFTWSGRFYEQKTCRGGRSCDEARFARPGTYRVELSGARAARTEAQASETDPDMLNGDIDPDAGLCTAVGEFELAQQPSQVEVTFACGGG